MSTLFLHIGTSKTGSTSLQNYLINNKDKLLNDNYYVYSNEDSGNFSSLAYIFSENESMGWINEINKLDTEEKKSNYKKAIKNELLLTVKNHPNHNFIISSEHLFTMWDNEKAIKSLYEFLKSSFDNIKIIVFIRDQLEYAISSSSTVINANYLSKLKFNYSKLFMSLSHPETFKDLYYDKSLELFAKYFGISNIKIEVYDKNNNSRNLFDAMTGFLGINHTDHYITPKAINTSSSLLVMKYKLHINSLLQGHEIDPSLQFTSINSKISFKKFINNQLEHIAKKNVNPMTPSMNIRKAWHKEFNNSNREVAKKFSLNGKKIFLRTLMQKIFYSKNIYSNSEYKKQFRLELNDHDKAKLQDLVTLIVYFNDFRIKNIYLQDRVNDLQTLLKPTAIGHIKILSASGYYVDSWVQKYFTLDYLNYKPISEIIIKIYNPESLKSSLTVIHEKKELTFEITNKRHELRVECYKIENKISKIEIKSYLDSSNKHDSRELSFLLEEIIFN